MRVLGFVLRAMTAVGVSQDTLRAVLARHHVDLEATDAFAPWAIYRELWIAAETACADEALGLRVAAAIPFGARDAIDYAIRTASTGHEVAALAMRLSPSVNGAAVPSVERLPEGVRVTSRLLTGLVATSAMNDFTSARMLGIVRFVYEEDVAPLRAYVVRSRPRDPRAHESFFRCPIEFDAPFNGLLLCDEMLARRLPHSDERLHRVLLSHPQLHAEAATELPLAERVARVASETFDAARTPSQISVARRLGLSARTLRRMLEAEGTSFASVIDDVRCTRARRQLLEGHRLADVAESLGYESTSTFVRAFRRWTGETPAAWRARRGDDADHTDGASTSDVRAPPRSTPT